MSAVDICDFFKIKFKAIDKLLLARTTMLFLSGANGEETVRKL